MNDWQTNAQKAPAKWELDGIRCIFANFSIVFYDVFRKIKPVYYSFDKQIAVPKIQYRRPKFLHAAKINLILCKLVVM